MYAVTTRISFHENVELCTLDIRRLMRSVSLLSEHKIPCAYAHTRVMSFDFPSPLVIIVDHTLSMLRLNTIINLDLTYLLLHNEPLVVISATNPW